MPSQLALKEDAEVNINAISLKHFPGKLRKVGKILLQSDTSMTLKEASEKAGVVYDTVRQEIWKHKKKGNDFHEFINRISDEYLNENLIAVDRSTLREAVSGTHNDRKLYYQRIGKLQETQGNINIGSLTIGINIGSLPADSGRDKGIIDVEPFIPGKK